MTSGGKEAVPFVKYQLLATMRAIGEKVAAQYVARAGKASYSALYELTRDVPNRGPDKEAAATASDLVERYQGDPATSLRREFIQLERDLQGKTKKHPKNCTIRTLAKTPLGVADALTFWHDNFAK